MAISSTVHYEQQILPQEESGPTELYALMCRAMMVAQELEEDCYNNRQMKLDWD